MSRTRQPFLYAVSLLVALATVGAAQNVTFTEREEGLVIAVGDTPMAHYVPGDAVTKRPYFKNLRAPGNLRVSRSNPIQEGDRSDHAALHPGLFLAFGDISGNDYWRGKARVVHDAYVKKPTGGPGTGSFMVRNRYLGANDETVCIETCTYTFLVRPAGYLLLWDSTFRSDTGAFSFGDQEEMGLAIRVHTPINVKGGTGRILNSTGGRNEKNVWGKTADWCDYSGTVDGKFAGVTLMPHPTNVRPCWFHARDYGVLVANPFGRKAFARGEPSLVTVKKGEAFQLRFGVLLHSGESEDSVDLDAAYADYLAVIGNEIVGGGKEGPMASLRADLMEQPGIVSARFLFEKAPFRSCHASTIAETKDYLVSAFFAGTDEGNKDVGIWVCRKKKGSNQWSPPVEVANGVQSPQERHPCWNPVLHRAADGPLVLFYKVGPSPRRWWGMRTVSTDQGATWAEPQRLPDRILGPVRAKPIVLSDGSLLCGSSTEHQGWRVHMERTTDLGKTWTRTDALNTGKDFSVIQPTILRYPGGRLQILCRSTDVLRESWSEDEGKTWGPLVRSSLPNPNAGIDAVTLRDGRQLLVYNHATRRTGGRSKLNVAVSSDGRQWKAALKLEDVKGVDGRSAYGAYPGAIQASDGLVHVVYTWKRERINYVVINPAKLVLRTMPGGAWPP